MVVEKVQSKIKQRTGNGFALPGDMLFRQMQTPNAANQHGRVWPELINLARLIGVADRAINGITQVNLPLDDFLPVRSQRIFEIRHEYFYIGIERVNDHFAFNRASDFNTAVLQISRDITDFPFGIFNGISFRNKIRQLPLINSLLYSDAFGQQAITLWRETHDQFRKKIDGFLCQNMCFVLTKTACEAKLTADNLL